MKSPVRLVWLAVLIFSVAAATAAPKKQRSAVSVGGDAMIIVDASGKVLFEQNPDLPREVASTQKLVTAIVVTRAGNLDKEVTITAQDAACSPTKLPNSVGGTYTRRQLLEALLVYSANDAARALARDNAGSEAAFGVKMTQLARQLGATRSVFKTSSGLSAAGQYSTARDMAKIARAAYRDRVVRDIAGMKFLSWRDAKGRMHNLRNSNRVLQRHANASGLKIGYTGAAGHCLVLSWEEAGNTVFTVVLGGKNELFWVEAALVTSLYANGLL